MKNSILLNSSFIEFILSCLLVLFVVLIFNGERIKQRLSYFSTYRWEKRKRNIYDFFYPAFVVIGIVISFAIFYTLVSILIFPFLLLYLLKLINKTELYGIIDSVTIINTILIGGLIENTCYFHEPARKVWKFLKNTFLGEDVVANGLIWTIKEHNEPVFRFQQSHEQDIIPNDNDYIQYKYCIIKMKDLNLSPNPVKIKIEMSLAKLREDGINLTNLSKCRIKCKRWRYFKSYLVAKEIQYIKQLQTLPYENFEMVC